MNPAEHPSAETGEAGEAAAATADTTPGFAALGLSVRLVRAAHELGYVQPTPVQAAVVPAALAGQDLQVSAATGSGKTAAYLFPLLQRLHAEPGRAKPGTPARAGAMAAPPARLGPRQPQLLVLLPTRELAAQVDDALRLLRRFLVAPVKVALLHGGVSINPQLMALRGGADVVIATPGRLLDVVAHNGIDLRGLRSLVLDEADRLLDAGFADETTRVLALLPRQRQTLLFSATWPPAVQALAQPLLQKPLPVMAAPVAEAGHAALALVDESRLEQRAIEVDAARRTPLLRHLIEQHQWPRVLVFVATRYACNHVADKLRQAGIEAAAFHGDASQGARTRQLAAFKAGQLRVLVATDLGARGIDIAQLPVVVNHDLPRSAVDHVHRIGRTARAGAQGLAISFVSADSEAHFRLIEKRQGRRVARERIAGFEPTANAAPAVAAGTGGVKGRRPSKKDKLRAAAAAAARRPG